MLILTAVITAATGIVAALIATSGSKTVEPRIGSADSRAAHEGPTTPAPAVFPPADVGSWTGTLQQSNGENWTMQVTIPADSAQAHVDYPQLACSGEWTVTASNGTALTVREKITVNVKRCSEFGTFDLVANGVLLDATYTPDDHRYRGSATLTRTG